MHTITSCLHAWLAPGSLSSPCYSTTCSDITNMLWHNKTRIGSKPSEHTSVWSLQDFRNGNDPEMLLPCRTFVPSVVKTCLMKMVSEVKILGKPCVSTYIVVPHWWYTATMVWKRQGKLSRMNQERSGTWVALGRGWAVQYDVMHPWVFGLLIQASCWGLSSLLEDQNSILVGTNWTRQWTCIHSCLVRGY